MRSTLEPIGEFSSAVRTIVAMFASGLFAFVLVAACTGGIRSSSTVSPAELAIRGGLDMAATVVDPAYALAVEGCKTEERFYLARAEADVSSIAAARADLTRARARCDRIVAAFEEIRGWHELAGAALEDGKLKTAQAELDKIVEAWRTLRERTSGP